MKDVPADTMRGLLGLREITYVSNNSPLAIVDSAFVRSLVHKCM
jgi:hypothetical protein